MALQPRVWTRSASTGTGGTSTIVVVQNDVSGFVLRLRSACVSVTPGAGQNYGYIQLMMIPADGILPTAPFNLKVDLTAGAANVSKAIDWQGDIFVPPMWYVRAWVSFNAGANNSVQLATNGLLLPLGDIQPT